MMQMALLMQVVLAENNNTQHALLPTGGGVFLSPLLFVLFA